MSTNGIKILGIDESSRSRGVGRYTQGLLDVVQKLPHARENVVINPFFSVHGARLASSNFQRNTNSVAVVHDLIPLKYSNHFSLGLLGKVRQKLNKSALKKYKMIVTDSLVSASDIHKMLGIPLEKMKVVYPFSPITEKQEKAIRPDKLPKHITKNGFALYVGDVNWHKNIVNIAKSCISANLTLVVVGKSFELLESKIGNHKELGELREFQSIWQNNTQLIQALGYVKDSELAWLYENALMNVLLSHDEGFGYSYVEAAHFGTPSILSDISIFREISGSRGAFFVDQNSIESISNALVHLKNSPEVRGEAGATAKIRSIFFSREKFASDWQKLLNSLN